jgi:hypothetical protein
MEFGSSKKVLMLRFTPELLAQRHWSGTSLLAFLSVLFIGCANTCFVAVSNPPNGTLGIVAGNSPPACPLAEAKGAVRVVAYADPSCEFCSESNRIQSVFLSLRGIDIHSKSKAGDESSDWQELLPQLKKQPRQIDLLNGSTNSRPVDPIIESALLPAGTYDLVRLRLVPNQAVANDETPAGNACGSLGASCAVMANGQIEPLVFDNDTLESRFAPGTTADRLFLVLPDSNSELHIELTPVASISASFAQGVRFFSLLPGRTTVERLPSVE